MTGNPVIRSCSFCLAHVPELVRFGSKPRRDLAEDQSIETQLTASLRSFQQAAVYPANRAFTGQVSVDELAQIPRPWFGLEESTGKSAEASGAFGELLSQSLFYSLLREADVLEPRLFEISDRSLEFLSEIRRDHNVFGPLASNLEVADEAVVTNETESGLALPIRDGSRLIGGFRRDDRAEGKGDANLDEFTLLENLCAKASGAAALKWLLHREHLEPAQIDYVISCGEEACGDRYQRGGGGMAKAIGELCGCINASGMDIKNFCAAPASALVAAGALVSAGLYDRVAVVAGGSVAKLGMKYRAFLKHGMPILDDCLASMAVLVTRDDGQSPILHLEPGAVGLATIGASSSDEAVYRKLILGPLQTLGLTMSDIDRYAPELHNPEIMEFAGSGDVVKKNYRMIAALGVLDGQFEKAEMKSFIERVGMCGFAPTQGHIPSAVPFLGHAVQAMQDGRLQRTMFLCKASLFLNRLTELFDGVSFILEANPGKGADVANTG